MEPSRELSNQRECIIRIPSGWTWGAASLAKILETLTATAGGNFDPEELNVFFEEMTQLDRKENTSDFKEKLVSSAQMQQRFSESHASHYIESMDLQPSLLHI